MSDAHAAGATHVVAGDARLSVEFAFPAGDTVAVRYRLHNAGDAPFAVFDRGDRHAVLTGRQVAGDIGTPTFEITGGSVTLRHVARSPGSSPTGQTLPFTPLARRVQAGGAVEGMFRFQVPAAPPTRWRWCLGIASFAKGEGLRPDGDVAELWRADAAAVARQQVLCTPWFDVSAGRFEPG
ncbi:hypothetical protein QFW80_08005 [Luteimonas sp. M1R5S18]|uniref:Uncharacterized protein n=1 Tax=Luteimonas rhizosphaericola TaxID=3042024 RepID=A0ABT6JIW6_9GAMM|nr:hypothetical protein [Luteimonas rhizosphaericola]MDH5830457.1 hypothetical protein [Luteimonas rhizosphaericola]